MALSHVVSEIFVVEKCRDLESRVKGHSRSSEPIRIDLPRMTSCKRSIVTMGLSRTVSEKNGDFCPKKSQIFHTPVYLTPPLNVPLGIGNRRKGSKTRMMGLPGRERSLTISSAVWIVCTNVTEGDRRTPDDSKDRAYA